MNRIRTTSDLQERLDDDFGWRIQEISAIKTAVSSSANMHNKMMLRAGITLLYAHWEGFVKNASHWYLDFVSNRRLKYEELKPCFIVFGLKRELNLLSDSKRHVQNVRAVEFLLGEMGNRAQFTLEGAVDTGSNLSSTVFQNIAESIGIDIREYELEFNFIDTSLLARRNRIAHGEPLDIVPMGYADLSDRVVGLMRRYKTDIENAVLSESYRAPTNSVSQIPSAGGTSC